MEFDFKLMCIALCKFQNFLIGGQNFEGGFDLLILPEYLLFFPDFSENSS